MLSASCGSAGNKVADQDFDALRRPLLKINKITDAALKGAEARFN